MKKLIIFDLDGTLFDSVKGLMESVNSVMRSAALPEITAEDTRRMTGNGTRALVERATNTFGKSTDKYYDIFIDDYNRTAEDNTVVYDGISELIRKLNDIGIKIAILTNKPQRTTEKLCKKLLGDYKIDYILGQRDGLPLKPDKAGVEEILNHFGLNLNEAILIGDSEVDAKTAFNAKVDFIGVLWGFRTKEQLLEAGATCFANNTDELYNIILKEIK